MWQIADTRLESALSVSLPPEGAGIRRPYLDLDLDSYENKRFAISTSGLLYQQTVCCMEKRFALKISGWL